MSTTGFNEVYKKAAEEAAMQGDGLPAGRHTLKIKAFVCKMRTSKKDGTDYLSIGWCLSPVGGDFEGVEVWDNIYLASEGAARVLAGKLHLLGWKHNPDQIEEDLATQGHYMEGCVVEADVTYKPDASGKEWVQIYWRKAVDVCGDGPPPVGEHATPPSQGHTYDKNGDAVPVQAQPVQTAAPAARPGPASRRESVF